MKPALLRLRLGQLLLPVACLRELCTSLYTRFGFVVFYLTPEGTVSRRRRWFKDWSLGAGDRTQNGTSGPPVEVRARGSSCSYPTQVAHRNSVTCFWMPKAFFFCSGDLWFGTAGRGGLKQAGAAAAEGLSPPGTSGCGTSVAGLGPRAEPALAVVSAHGTQVWKPQ